MLWRNLRMTPYEFENYYSKDSPANSINRLNEVVLKLSELIVFSCVSLMNRILVNSSK